MASKRSDSLLGSMRGASSRSRQSTSRGRPACKEADVPSSIHTSFGTRTRPRYGRRAWTWPMCRSCWATSRRRRRSDTRWWRRRNWRLQLRYFSRHGIRATPRIGTANRRLERSAASARSNVDSLTGTTLLPRERGGISQASVLNNLYSSHQRESSRKFGGGFGRAIGHDMRVMNNGRRAGGGLRFSRLCTLRIGATSARPMLISHSACSSSVRTPRENRTSWTCSGSSTTSCLSGGAGGGRSKASGHLETAGAVCPKVP